MQMAELRESGQTMALCSACFVARSQTRVVSRWLVRPTACTQSWPHACWVASRALAMQVLTVASSS